MSHPPSAEGVVLVDFDGTIFPWGQLKHLTAPIPGAVIGIRRLRRLGYRIGIFTSRLSASWHEAEGRDPVEGCAEQVAIIEQALKEYDIPFDFITAEKVPAILYLDDKAMRVTKARPIAAAVQDFIMWGDDAI